MFDDVGKKASMKLHGKLFQLVNEPLHEFFIVLSPVLNMSLEKTF